jgi:antitoxin CcdA
MKHTAREQAAVYDVSAPKRATNVTVNVDLLRRARELEINLSQTLEAALLDAVRAEGRRRWLAENRQAIEAYNRDVAEHGCFGDAHRPF